MSASALLTAVVPTAPNAAPSVSAPTASATVAANAQLRVANAVPIASANANLLAHAKL